MIFDFLTSFGWPLFLSMFTILLIEAFFSGSEMALVSADRLALKRMAMQGSKGAQAALALLNQPEQMLATLLIGTNLCIFAQGAIVTIFVHKKYGLSASHDFYSVLFLSPIILIFGELIPKTVFQRFSTFIAPKIAIPVALFKVAFSPAIFFISKYSRWLSKKIRPIEEFVTGKHVQTSREVLTYLVSRGKKEITIPSFEGKMIHRILGFSRTQAKNAMIPLVQVDAIPNTSNVRNALEVFYRTRHSRLPVFKDRIDNIIGILHVHDTFSEKNLDFSVSKLIRLPTYFPETQKIEDMLFSMQPHGVHMGIIVDEYGGAVGILTLEDLVEEIVGDISDEYDSEAQLYQEVGPNQYIVQGRIEIETLNDRLKFNVPLGPYKTLAGFLLQQFNRIPEEGDELYFGKLKFIIRKANERAIHQVYISNIE